MTCHNCSTLCKKFGKYGPKRIQRWRCKQCKRTFSAERDKPLDDMRIPLERAEMCLKLLLEGMSIRSVQRITGLHQETILDLIVLAGERCEKLMSERIKGVAVRDVQADEMWGFVGMKEKTRERKGLDDLRFGDAYSFVGIERNTKMVLAWHLGRRNADDTMEFMGKLADATSGDFQLTTDGFASYRWAVGLSFRNRAIDFAQLIKVYAADREGETRYSPPVVVETKVKSVFGRPDPERICTSHVERQNLSMRTSIRRLTRLTNGFSKKWENLKAMLAIYFAFYNFCRIHSTIRCTPAMESGITQHVWTLRELLAA